MKLLYPLIFSLIFGFQSTSFEYGKCKMESTFAEEQNVRFYYLLVNTSKKYKSNESNDEMINFIKTGLQDFEVEKRKISSSWTYNGSLIFIVRKYEDKEYAISQVKYLKSILPDEMKNEISEILILENVNYKEYILNN